MSNKRPRDWLDEAEQQIQILEKRKVLKNATKSLDKKQFKDDEDYLLIWFHLIDLERNLNQDYSSISDIFKYMGSNRIGVKSPLLYIKWAKFEDSYQYTDRAKRILQAAIHSNVEPIHALQTALDSLESSSPQPPSSTSSSATTDKENTVPLPQSASRRPLQEKQVTSSSSSTSTTADLSTQKQKSDNETTMNFKARMNRGRGKLGPPARLARSIVEQEITDYGNPTNQKSFPSPESLNSASPKSSKSSNRGSPLVNTFKSPAPTLSSEMENLELEDSSSDSSVEDLGRMMNSASGEETQNMDLSHTVTFIGKGHSYSQQTPRPNPVPPPTNQQHQQEHEEISGSSSDKNYITINGKQYFKSGLIGKGGSCKVFKLIDPSNGKIFALKKVKLRGQDQSVVDGYKNEIILLDKLKNNDRIIHLYGASHDQQNQTLMMILEYGEVDLEKMLQKDLEAGRISINFVRNYWEQMVQAVQAIHDQNIIHSDLKPANFLLVAGCLKLIDFGIAKAIQNDTTNIHRDHQSGTVNYMSPESIMPHVEMPGVNPKTAGSAYLKQGRASDVWSLGCILYRLVYHHPPFGKMALMVKLVAITNPKHVIPYPDPPMGVEFLQVLPVLKGCLVFEPKKRLTIPQILAHEFLRGSGKQKDALSLELVSRILRRGVELNVGRENVDSVANVCIS